jgi:hypothetical protein
MVANLMKHYSLFALLLLSIIASTAGAQVLSDPTRPPPGLDGSSLTSGVAAYPQVRGLQSVIISPKHCAAIIDGKTVVLGAKHGNERLVEVSERGVVLQGENGRRSLILFPAVGMKPTETVPTGKQELKCQFKQNKKALSPPEPAGQEEEK